MSAKQKNIDFNTDKVGRLLFRLSLPTVTVTVITSIVNFFSGAIVASVSIDYLTAHTICAPFLALVSAMYVGIVNGAASLTGRNITSKDTINKVIFNSTVLLSLFMLIYVLIAIFSATPFLRLFTTNDTVLRISVKYIYLHSLAAIITGFSQTLIGILQALGDTTITSLFSLASIPVTFFLNFITVNGYLGMPKMGLYGISVTAIFMALLNFSFATIRLKTKGLGIFKNREISKSFIKQIFTIALPSMLQQFLATSLVSGYNLVIKGISESAVAVMGVFYNWANLLQAFNLRFSLFSIIGSNLTLGRRDRIRKTIRYSIGYVLFISTLFTLFFLFFTRVCLNIFNYPEEQIAQGIYIFRILSIYALPMMLFTILNNFAIALGNSKTGFVALFVQTSITLIGGFAFSGISSALSLFSFSFAAIAALFAVIIMICNSKSSELKMLKNAFIK